MSVPKLRFKSFTAEWSKRRLDSFLERVSKPVDVVDVQEYVQIGIRSHGKGIFHKEAVTGKELGNKRVFWIVPNALVVNIVFAWERAIAVTSENENGLIASHRFPMYLPKNNLSNVDFLRYMFITNKGQSYLELASPGGAGRNKTLGQSNFAELKIDLPDVEEQTKIASFLSAVDEKISQLTQKHELLSQYKQGMMQKLFSQQIRFKADDGSEFGEWESYKLFDLAKDKTLNNGVFNDQNKVGKGYKLINVLDMYIKRDIDESRLNLLDLDKKEFEKNKVSYGDIFFTRSSLVKEGIAFSNVYLGVSNDITYDGHLIKLSPNLNIVEPKFLNYCLKTADVRKQLIQGGKTATMTTIGQQEVGNTIVNIPCLEEQTKIANFLFAIDQKIEVVAKQIEQAKQWKKGLLQQMFV